MKKSLTKLLWKIILNENQYYCNGKTYNKISFKKEKLTLSYNAKTYSEIEDFDGVAGFVDENISWEEAKNACTEGTHLAKAVELKQLNDAGILQTMCSTCSVNDYPSFWAQEEESSKYGYVFSPNSVDLYNTKGVEFTKKSGTTRKKVVCVSD